MTMAKQAYQMVVAQQAMAAAGMGLECGRVWGERAWGVACVWRLQIVWNGDGNAEYGWWRWLVDGVHDVPG